MDATPSQPPPTIKKGLANVKGSSVIASQSLQAVASQIQGPPLAPIQTTIIPTSASSTVVPSNIAPALSKLQSPLQVLEQEEYGTDTSASSFTTPRSEEPTDTSKQAAPPNLPFRELVQRVREFLSNPDPAAEEHYKQGLALGRDPLLLQEKAGRPPSIKLSMVADLSCLHTAQDEAVKPSTFHSTLDIGKFPAIPPHKGSWYNVVDKKY